MSNVTHVAVIAHVAGLQIHYISPARPLLLVKNATGLFDRVLICMHRQHTVIGLDLRRCLLLQDDPNVGLRVKILQVVNAYTL